MAAVADELVKDIDRTARPGEVLTRDVPMTGSPRFVSYSGLYGDNFDRYTNPDSIAFETYNQMRQHGMIKAALTLIKAPILSCVQKATVECDDPRIKRFVETQFVENGLLYRLCRTSLTAMEFGVAVHEKVWDVDDLHITYHATDEDDGEDYEDVAWSGPALVYREFRAVNPLTVLYVLRDPKTRQFAGFVQSYAPSWLSTGQQQPQPQPEKIPGASKMETVDGIPVAAAKAFLYSHDSEFGNLWGNPRIRPAYPYYYWAMVILKYWMAWAERKLVPTRLVRHPVGRDQDGTDYSDVAIALGSAIDDVASVAIPNTMVREAGTQPGGDYQWKFEELQTTDKAETFELIAGYLDTGMLRSMFVPERTFTTGQGFGLFSTDAQAHTDTFLMTEDAEAGEWVDAVNVDAVKPLVVANFGSNAPAAKIVVPGITDAHKEMLREILNSVLGNPDVIETLDVKAILEQLGVPVSDVEPPTAAATPDDSSAPDDADEAAAADSASEGEQPANPSEAATVPSGTAAAGDSAPPAAAAAGPVPDNLVLAADDEPAPLTLEDYATGWRIKLQLADVGIPLSDDEALDLIRLAFDSTRWNVSADPKALNGYKVIDNQTGKRLTGFAAQQVVVSYLAQSKVDAKSAASKAASAQKKAATQATAAEKRAETKAAADAKRQQAADQRAAKKSVADALRAQKTADTAARKAASAARVAQAKADRLQTAASKKAAHDALVEQHKAETAAKAAARHATQQQALATRQQAKADRQQASAQKSQAHAQAASLKQQKSSLQKTTAKQPLAQAAQSITAAGFTIEGQPAGDLASAVTAASKVASGNPNKLVTVIQTGGGFIVASKAAGSVSANPSNVALSESGHAPVRVDASLIDSAAQRIGRLLKGRGA